LKGELQFNAELQKELQKSKEHIQKEAEKQDKFRNLVLKEN
jgi:hypothetical protein